MNGTVVSPSPLWMRLVFGRNPKVTLIRLISLIALTFVLFRFVLLLIRVTGQSMSPTYQNGTVDVVNRMAYRWSRPKRGDVVALQLPEDHNMVLIKRIVGLPGERVRFKGGRVLVNGEFLEERYATRIGPRALSTPKAIQLADDEYLVVGDDRIVSDKYRIPEHYILGKVIF